MVSFVGSVFGRGDLKCENPKKWGVWHLNYDIARLSWWVWMWECALIESPKTNDLCFLVQIAMMSRTK